MQADLQKSLKDKFRGSVLWSAVGDALGSPLEFRSKHNITREINAILKSDNKMDLLGSLLTKRSWTDDTQMQACHSRSLIRQKGFDPEDTAKEFVAWKKSGDTRGIGRTTREALTRLEEGIPWNKAGIDGTMSAGNGPAMKIAPLALFYFDDLNILHKHCEAATIITHNNFEGIAGARAVAFAVAKAIQNKFNPETFIDETINYIGESAVAQRLLVAQEYLLANELPSKTLAKLGTSGYIVETVAAAFYCFLKTPKNPIMSIIRAIAAGGDTDTTAAIVGSISGAYNGSGKIPAKWLLNLEDFEGLTTLADCLFEARS